MQQFEKWLIVTDLDGTLLGHDDYAFEVAIPAIEQLQSLQVPIIFNTSKTYPETQTLRQQLGISDPFVIENGSAVFIPDSTAMGADSRRIELGMSLAQIRQRLAKIIKSEDQFIALPDLTVDQIVKLTGLNPGQAKAAAMREYSLPIIWQGSDDNKAGFIQRLRQAGMQVLQGGRFLHLQGQTDKARALQVIRDLYPEYGIAVMGDSGNDLAMLEAADLSMVIQSPGNQYLADSFSADFKSTTAAPSGWVEGTEYLLKLGGHVVQGEYNE